MVESGESLGGDSANGKESRFLVGEEEVDDSPAVEMGGVGGAPSIKDDSWVISIAGKIGDVCSTSIFVLST